MRKAATKIELVERRTETGQFNRVWITMERLNPALRKRVDGCLGTIRRALEENEREQAKERDVLMKRLPKTLLEKHAAGYTQNGEIDRAICNVAIDDCSFERDPWQGAIDDLQTKDPKGLSDEEFVQLGKLKELAPDGADIEPVEAWIDLDDERSETRRIFLVSWLAAGLTARMIVPMDLSTAIIRAEPEAKPEPAKKAKPRGKKRPAAKQSKRAR